MLGQWRLSRIGSVAATVLLLANCAVGPDFQQPAAPDVTGYTPQPLAEQTSSADVKGGEAQRDQVAALAAAHPPIFAALRL